MKKISELDFKKVPTLNKKTISVLVVSICFIYATFSLAYGYYWAGNNITKSSCAEKVSRYSSGFYEKMDNPLKELMYDIKRDQCSDNYSARIKEHQKELTEASAIYDYCIVHSSLSKEQKATLLPAQVTLSRNIMGEYPDFEGRVIIERGKKLSKQWEDSKLDKANACLVKVNGINDDIGKWTVGMRDMDYAGYRLQGASLTYDSKLVSLTITCDKNLGADALMYNLRTEGASFYSHGGKASGGIVATTDERSYFSTVTFDVQNSLGASITATEQIDDAFKETGVISNFNRVIQRGLLDDAPTGIFLDWNSLENVHTYTIKPSKDFSEKHAEMLDMCK